MAKSYLKKLPGKLKDLTNKRFGRLVVIRYLGKRMWECVCDCGVTKPVFASNLKRGAPSCGCYRREWIGNRRRIHGFFGARVYHIWDAMIQRCRNPKFRFYYNYGGRGIYVCQEWLRFTGFLAWVMLSFPDGNVPEHLSLDRYPDNDGPYSPDNCRWATRKEQGNNTRANRLWTYQGKTQSITQWAREYGKKPSKVSQRINSGWSIHKALTTP